MHFTHSMWTKPMIVNRRNLDFKSSLIVNTFTAAASVAWVNACGGKINLYADGFGKDLLGYLPYDNVYDLTIPDSAPACNWAAGKFLTLEKMPLGDVHIDCDVFLKSDKLLETIADTNYDMVIQSIEDDKDVLKQYYTESRNILQKHNITAPTCSLDEAPSYNCGTVGFFNAELKEKYLKEYFGTLANIMKNKECVKELNITKTAIPDLILEQQFLYELSNGYNVNNLLGTTETMYDKAIDMHYQHVCGGFKEQQINNIAEELNFINPDIYKKTLKHINYLM